MSTSTKSLSPEEGALITPAVLAVVGSVFLFSDKVKLQAAAPILLSTSLAYSFAHHLHFKNNKEQ